MPLLEVTMTGLDGVSQDSKHDFANAVAAIFREILGTPRERVQLVLRDVRAIDCADALLAPSADDRHKT
jgi:phenylpyruvate tautomerase PptA (4-oxalocrotonate tautomerase family)